MEVIVKIDLHPLSLGVYLKKGKNLRIRSKFLSFEQLLSFYSMPCFQRGIIGKKTMKVQKKTPLWKNDWKIYQVCTLLAINGQVIVA